MLVKIFWVDHHAKTQALDTRKIFLGIQALNKQMPFSPINPVGSIEQTSATAQDGLVLKQAFCDGGRRIFRLEVKALFHIFAVGLVGDKPGNAGQNQRNNQNNPGGGLMGEVIQRFPVVQSCYPQPK